MKPKTAIHLINKIFNPLILWSFGWKRKTELYAGKKRVLWQNPRNKHWLVEDVAIYVCEAERLANGKKWYE